MTTVSPWSLPVSDLLSEQADWLAPARSRLLRQAHIARRKRVLDLGAGYGSVTTELARRAGGSIISLEPQLNAIKTGNFDNASRTCGIATALPYQSATFDLVYSQLTLLWVQPLQAALTEIARILEIDGVFLAIEPDYAGMIEYPDEIVCRDLWLAGLSRAGADPYIGRKLPSLLAGLGFHVQVSLFEALYAPDMARFDFLADLPLRDAEQAQLAQIQWTASNLTQPWSQVAHLPHMLIYAVKH